MQWLATTALWGMVPVVLVLFLFLPPRRAVLVSMIGAWLFLPQLAISMQLVPDYTKMTATCYGIILGALLLDPESRVLKFKPLWIDLPILVWCVCPFFTSISNDLGAYDGASAVVGRMIKDGLPYLIGRLYFRTLEDVKDFALGIVLGGIVYVPFCLYEIRMSPHLHEMLYGFRPFSDWAQAKRWGGFRPTVFMKHGLAVGVWMTTTAAMAFWLWRTRSMKQVLGVPMLVIVPVMVLTAVLCKAAGAIILFSGIMAAMLAVRFFGTKKLMMGLVILVPVFLGLRATQVFTGTDLAVWIEGNVPLMEQRAKSLRFRMDHENAIVQRAYERPLLGWGGWSRAFDTYLEEYRSFAVPDSLWVRTFGQNGVVGLTALYSLYLVPLWLLLRKLKAKEWSGPDVAPLTGLGMICLIFAMDGLFNNMENPVFVVAIGAVSTMAAMVQRVPKAQPARPDTPRGPAGDTDEHDGPLGDLGLAGGGEPLILVDPPMADGRGSGGLS
ncbi:MAG: O-antigen ligase domain-containing protein [Planctomycetota bacterium]